MRDYVLLYWPESQDYMDHPDFCQMAIAHPEISGAYFIPLSMWIEVNQ